MFVFWYIFYIKLPIIKIVIYLILAFIPFGLIFITKNFNVFKILQPWFDQIFHFSLKQSLIEYINNSYDEKTASFIKLLILNYKDQYAKAVYNQMINLSIVYLIVIGGFHLSILKKVINFCFKKHFKIALIVNLLLIFFYSYLLSFSISACRVLITMICGLLLKKYSNNKYDRISLSGFLSLIIAPSIVKNIGFSLSYICTLGVCFIYSLKIKNHLLNQIVINVVSTLISLPFIYQINHSINVFSILNSLIFTYIFAFVFLIMLMIFWIKWIWFIHYLITIFVINAVNCFNLISITINLFDFNPLINTIYFSFLITIIIVISNIKSNNKHDKFYILN